MVLRASAVVHIRASAMALVAENVLQLHAAWASVPSAHGPSAPGGRGLLPVPNAGAEPGIGRDRRIVKSRSYSARAFGRSGAGTVSWYAAVICPCRNSRPPLSLWALVSGTTPTYPSPRIFVSTARECNTRMVKPSTLAPACQRDCGGGCRLRPIWLGAGVGRWEALPRCAIAGVGDARWAGGRRGVAGVRRFSGRFAG